MPCATESSLVRALARREDGDPAAGGAARMRSAIAHDMSQFAPGQAAYESRRTCARTTPSSDTATAVLGRASGSSVLGMASEGWTSAG